MGVKNMSSKKLAGKVAVITVVTAGLDLRLRSSSMRKEQRLQSWGATKSQLTLPLKP